MSVTIPNNQVDTPNNTAFNNQPEIIPGIVKVYNWAVGVLSLLILALLLLIPSEAAQITNLIKFNNSTPNVNFELIVAAIYVIGSTITNYYVASTKNYGHLTLSMLFYFAAFLSVHPILAALVPVISSVWFELFIGKRGAAFAARTAGMYILCELGAAYTYQALAGGPLKGDITVFLLVFSLLGFVVFRVINDVIYQLTYVLQGELFLKPIIDSFVPVYLPYIAMLPGALVLASLAGQNGFLALILGVAITVSVAILLQRLSLTSQTAGQQLQLTQQLNSRLLNQTERQGELGNRINQTLDSFLALVRDYAGTSHEQEAAIVEITATIEQLSRTAAQIASSTDKVAGAADKAIDAADQGQNSVTNTVNAIKEVQVQVREIATIIQELNQKSEQIGDIVTTINQIANEIRLLALNATIEASGAGPYGRRFAVVAGEVSDLADRSREAAAAIRRIISEIQSATTSSVHATEEGLQKMERSIAIAAQSEKANNEIIEMVERTAQTAAAIALATQQQLSASEQVVNSMHEIASLIGDNAQKVAGVSVASLELQRVARELQDPDHVETDEF